MPEKDDSSSETVAPPTGEPVRTVARALQPSGLLALAMANLIQVRGTRETLRGDVPGVGTGSLQQRLDEVAAAQPESAALRGIMSGIRHWETALICLVAMVAAAVLGTLTAAGILEAPAGRPVNLFWILGAVLGGQSLLLVLWILLAILGGRLLGRCSLGGAIAGIARIIAGQLGSGPRRGGDERRERVEAASAAVTHVDFGGPRTRWALGTITHLGWTFFNIGLLGGLVVILSIRQVDFGWETTIGSEAAFKQVGEAISRLPEAIGFKVPSEAEFASARIEASGSNASSADARRAFSGLIIGCLILYGLLPRCLLLVLSVLLWKRAVRRWRPDVDSPNFAPLRALAEPRPVAVETIPDPGVQQGDAAAGELADPERTARGSAIVGIELETPECGWPPPCDATVTDLGIVSSREDRAAVVRRVALAEHSPSRLVIVVDLATTPDRGMARTMRRFHEVTGDSILNVVLTGGDRFRRRCDARVLEQRVSDWKLMVGELQTRGTVTELDLDRLTAVSRARLNELIAGKGRPELPGDRGIMGVVDTAFAEIAAHVRKWPTVPEASDLVALHRAVASCAGARATGGLAGLPEPTRLVEHPREGFQQAVEAITSVMPDRLTRSSRWVAIGGAAGVLACLATAGTLAPAALAALPGWLAAGAAGGGVLALLGGGRKPDSEDSLPEDDPPARLRGEAASAAALLTVVLAMQGAGERRIQQAIDRTFTEDPPELEDAEQAGHQLGRWRASLAGLIEEHGA
ncbi:MAG: DUF2868 domain-containing protein [Planctomycetota bacterium]|nr:DUF2868 domain-containing protein [Planctomycetota bacterium]